MTIAAKYTKCRDLFEEPINSLLGGDVEYEEIEVGQPPWWWVLQFKDGSILGFVDDYASSELIEIRESRSIETARKFFKRPPNDRGLLDYVFRKEGKAAPNIRKMEKALGRKLKEGETVPLEEIARTLGIAAVVRICRYVDKKDVAVAAHILEDIAEAVARKYGHDYKQKGWFFTIGEFLAKARKIKKYGKGKIRILRFPIKTMTGIEELAAEVISKYRRWK